MKYLVCLIVGISLLSACGVEDAPVARWEHSLTGLYSAEISKNGRFAVVSSFSDGTSLWDLRENRRKYDWRHNDSIDSSIAHVAFSPDSRFVITTENSTFVIWSVESGAALGYWAAEADILSVAISNGANHVLLGLKDGRAIHIDRRSGRRLEVIAHRNEWVSTVALSGDGVIAATGGNDRRVMVWNAVTGEELFVFEHSHRVVKVAFDDNQKKLLSADESANAFVWSLETGKKISRLALERDGLLISAARFSESGEKLLLGFPGRQVSLWSAASGKQLRNWRTPTRKHGWVPQGSTVYAVAFKEGERLVVAESSNGLGGSWRISTGG